MSDEEPTMKKRVSVGVVLLLFALTTLSGSALSGQDRAGSEGIRERFIGAWRLVWLEEPGADGKVQRADCTGSLVFSGASSARTWSAPSSCPAIS